ncbi:hypothetical protein Ahy_B10g105048 [Arachis hypogaea]|uniref:Aminotransferase-like plant mobile domain-containing protein n=1 Tax=Arachis hypogaea TaxID=3818 RepID=A0A444X725_ARAHY|nr:hypothetical protein Ahy_B10g105048 [Arachis hypogaea]
MGNSNINNNKTQQLHVTTDQNSITNKSTEVSVLKETDEVSLRGFLESGDGAALKPEIGLEILRNLTNEALERKFADQKLSALLRSKTRSFVLPTGEVTVTLEDVLHIFGLPIDGEVVTG